MGSKSVLATLAGTALAMALGGSAEAATITWYTCSSGGTCTTPSPRVGGGDDPFSFTAVGGQQLVTEAFEVSSPVNNDPINSIFQGGLGAGGENNPEHSVDNTNQSDPSKGNELIVFTFPEDGYIPKSFRIGWVGSDSDTQTWIGGALGGTNDIYSIFAGEGYEWGPTGGGDGTQELVDFGYVRQDFSGNGSPGTYNFTGTAAGRYLIIAAPTGFDEDDQFKIQSIVANTPNGVPEPGTVILLGAGLAALALRRKRQ